MLNFDELVQGSPVTPEMLDAMLRLSGEEEKKLFQAAYEIKKKEVGSRVYYRGLIEYSNLCKKNCYYCGIRAENRDVSRYKMSEDEIVAHAVWAYRAGYGSAVIQGGEVESEENTVLIENALKRIKTETEGKLGLTLSLGEQTAEVYDRWFHAGAHRYLLRIETSNPLLYSKIHPANHSFERRLECLRKLKETGWQAGTGVMIGLPFQTYEDLVNDLIFFKEEDIGMIGMGPYIPHSKTPLAEMELAHTPEERFHLALRMVAAARIFLRDVNIAATTALQTLQHDGREQGLLAGANVIMPNLTDVEYRENYLLYDNKPCIKDDSSHCQQCLNNRIQSIGEEVAYNEWGDSPHYKNREKLSRK